MNIVDMTVRISPVNVYSITAWAGRPDGHVERERESERERENGVTWSDVV